MTSYRCWRGGSLAILVIAVGASLPPLDSNTGPSLSPSCWEGCTCESVFQLVRCPDLDLPSIPYKTVHNNTRALYLPGNLIANLTGRTLLRFRQLRLLDLADNQISQIADDAFEGQPKLMQLILSGNKLSNVPVAALQRLKSLRTLDLARNNITYLAADSFLNVTKLQSLSLNSNALHVIDPGAFTGLGMLRVLMLKYNFLEEIPIGSLSACGRLEQLHLSSNRIGTLYNQSESLGELSVRSWFAPTQPRSLATLILSQNLIDFFSPSCFQGMTALAVLDLSWNYIQEIPEDLFKDLQMLETLKLNKNSPLYALPPGVFRDTFSLRILKIKYCQLTDLPVDLLYNTSQLEFLDLTGNGLSDLNFLSSSHVTSLTELCLGENSITDIPDDHLFGLSMLKVLNLSENQMTRLPLLNSLSSLQVLDAKKNQLTWLRRRAFRGTSLMDLDVSFNKLQTLRKSTIMSLPDYAAATINLYGNPWACDCHLSWTVDVGYGRYFLSDYVTCSWPREFENITLYSSEVEVVRNLKCSKYPKRDHLLLLIGTWFGVVSALILLFWAAAFVHARRRFRVRQPRERFLLFRNPSEKNAGCAPNTTHSKVRFKALDSETESLEDDETTV
ncbi:platelet glycoprotein V-like [Acanthaster planci]|uniref:Platelet glycoprotein V-like n=1 Tax=Acanthaster planci TaxID=133434 RepID=A0A8B7ZMW5_ACAPL|nr:platelet glycoprotein V-like [Acanthaster planci]XP_022104707.1 platelet glycoprotein V-like [Acanthaster planci]